MATLCVGYLGFPCFDPACDDADMPTFIALGYYGLFDYAYAYWSHHLDACTRLHGSEGILKNLSEATEVFIDTHWIDSGPSTIKKVLRQPFIERWKPLESNGNLDRLVVAGWLARRQTATSTKPDADEQVLALHRMVPRIRASLEDVSKTTSEAEKFRSMYGSNIYKCPRVNCVHFYDGFSSERLRDDHVPKHERSFFCSFSGCAMSTIGCATLKELHKHENEYHGTIDLDDDEPEYPEIPAEKTTFQCTQCDAKFTRNSNLKIHMRKHNAPDQKSFVCSQCGKSFSRLGDRTRHESTTHSNAKVHACRGKLNDGSVWGCGREFNRGDMLNRHWKGDKGKNCIRPKHEEEVRDAANTGTSSQPSNVSTPMS